MIAPGISYATNFFGRKQNFFGKNGKNNLQHNAISLTTIKATMFSMTLLNGMYISEVSFTNRKKIAPNIKIL